MDLVSTYFHLAKNCANFSSLLSDFVNRENSFQQPNSIGYVCIFSVQIPNINIHIGFVFIMHLQQATKLARNDTIVKRKQEHSSQATGKEIKTRLLKKQKAINHYLNGILFFHYLVLEPCCLLHYMGFIESVRCTIVANRFYQMGLSFLRSFSIHTHPLTELFFDKHTMYSVSFLQSSYFAALVHFRARPTSQK